MLAVLSDVCICPSHYTNPKTPKKKNFSASLHVYIPLRYAYNILIIINPSSNPASELRFSFHQASLNDLEGKYKAISYTWGKIELESPLYCPDNTIVQITKNVDCALRRLCNKSDQHFFGQMQFA
ncbi:hypothetical protein CC78DRAFT_270241 [Lojkania enalia]|uniref:Heterokaryon incompatibility domain-containing protein n=1 Tax=Lojkania enalia TaxID=147567 RepID=A0A9P4N815_9PLEO|nr:hypothetical protein CC78DRAFT_270241 [Didymosphaeria enalia]